MCRQTQVPQPMASTNCQICEQGRLGPLGSAESPNSQEHISGSSRKSKWWVQATLPHRMTSKLFSAAKLLGGCSAEYSRCTSYHSPLPQYPPTTLDITSRPGPSLPPHLCTPCFLCLGVPVPELWHSWFLLVIQTSQGLPVSREE